MPTGHDGGGEETRTKLSVSSKMTSAAASTLGAVINQGARNKKKSSGASKVGHSDSGARSSVDGAVGSVIAGKASSSTGGGGETKPSGAGASSSSQAPAGQAAASSSAASSSQPLPAASQPMPVAAVAPTSSGIATSAAGYKPLPVGPEEANAAEAAALGADAAPKAPLPVPVLAFAASLFVFLGIVGAVIAFRLRVIGGQEQSSRANGEEAAAAHQTPAVAHVVSHHGDLAKARAGARAGAGGQPHRGSAGQDCDSPAATASWTRWSRCPRCGGGHKTRRRELAKGYEECRSKLSLLERRSCAPAFRLVSEWSSWGSCSASCGLGRQHRSRKATADAKGCEDELPKLEERRLCELRSCPGEQGPGQRARSSASGQRPRAGAENGSSAVPSPSRAERVEDAVEALLAAAGAPRGHARPSESENASLSAEPQGPEEGPAASPGRPSSAELVEDAAEALLAAAGAPRGRARPGRSGNASSPAEPRGRERAPATTHSALRTTTSAPAAASTTAAPASNATTRPEEGKPFGVECPRGSLAAHLALSGWSPWSECSTSCGSGTRSRARHVLPEFEFCYDGSSQLPPLRQRQSCGPWTSESVLGPWSDWGSCSVSCGHGHETRKRRPPPPGLGCPAPATLETATRVCSSPCPAACPLSQWGVWSECSASCGAGHRVRRRSPLQAAGSAECADVPGQEEEWPCAGPSTCPGPPCRLGGLQPPPVWHAVPESLQHCDGVAEGRSCDFLCADGYRPSHPLFCIGGMFQFDSTSCEEAPCDEPPVIPHGTDASACAGAVAGSLCRISCQEGYEKTGHPVCHRGRWSYAACEPVLCEGEVRLIPHAAAAAARCVDWFPLQAKPGAACPDFACQPGFRPSGGLRCVGGNWAHPRCIPTADASTSSALVQTGGSHKAHCEGIPQVPHSLDLGPCAGALDGTSCRVSCLPGFRRSEDAQCHGTGWVGGRCAPANCPRPPAIENGRIDVERCSSLGTFGICPLACDDGYEREGDLRCLGTTFSAARCVAASCRDPPNVQHAGDLSACAGAPAGSVCSLQCLPGYAKTGDVLCVHGKWSPAKCKPIQCYATPRIPHARRKALERCAGTYAGEACTVFACEDGYSATDDLWCRRGRFNAPVCRPIGCENAPEVPNSLRLQCAWHGDVRLCTVECSGGHVKESDAVCVEGRWSVPRCLQVELAEKYETSQVRIRFSMPPSGLGAVARRSLAFEAALASGAAEDAAVTADRVRVSQVSMGNISADGRGHLSALVEISPPAPEETGEHVRGARTAAEWLQAKAWGLGLRSIEKIAPSSSLTNVEVVGHVAGASCLSPPGGVHASGLSDCAPAISGQLCTLRCGSGYEPTAQPVCFNGTWAPPNAECAEMPCRGAPPHVPGGMDLSVCQGYPSGSVCTVTCQQGYRKVEDLTCSRGHWTGGRCEPAACETAPVIAHSAALEECAGMPSGHSCHPLCLEGYTTTSVLGIPCKNGNWRYDATPLCQPVGCSTAPVVPHSQPLGHCAGTSAFGTCHLTCEKGFEAVGELLCVMGQWSHPECRPKKCDSAPLVGGALLQRCMGTASGQVCPLVCPAGQVSTGDLLCLNGAWLGEARVLCRSASQGPGNSCAAAPTVANGDTAACAGTPSGRACDVPGLCAQGYRLEGTLLCIDGQWSSAACAPQPCSAAPQLAHGWGASLALCRGTPRTGTCAPQCQLGFLPQDAQPLVCNEGSGFKAGQCMPRPCASYPVVPHAVDLSHCEGMAHGSTCIVSCSEGYKLSGGPVLCKEGRWVLGSTRCEEAPCKELPPALRGPGLEGCAGTPSRGTCTGQCPLGLLPGPPLLCLRGRWQLPSAAAPCRELCAAPPVVEGADLRALNERCGPAEVGGRCTLPCKAGLRASGQLLCEKDEPRSGKLPGGSSKPHWSLATCEDPGRLGGRRVFQLFELQGVEVRSPSEQTAIREALLQSFASHLALSASFMVLVLQLREVAVRAELRISCSEAACPAVIHRLRRAESRLPVLAASLADGLCARRCRPPRLSQPETLGAVGLAGLLGPDPGGCLARCPEAGGNLAVLTLGEPVMLRAGASSKRWG